MKNSPLTQIFIWVSIFILTAMLGLYVRFYPARADLWSDNTEKATAIVIAKIRMTLADQVNRQYPQLPESQRNSLIEEQFAQTLHKESAMVKQAIREVSKNIPQQSSENTKTIYLQEADGYYYYDLTNTIVKTGQLGKTKGSKFHHEKMGAPYGFWQPINWHPYVGYFLYKAANCIFPGISVMNALCYSGPILSLFALGAFLFCCRSLSLGPLASTIGAIYFYLAPIFVKRSTYAWNDDDSYNLLFPLLIFGVMFRALKSVRTIKQALGYGLIIAGLLAIYSLFWHGWGYTFAILCASGILIVAIQFMTDRNTKSISISPSTQPALPLAPLFAMIITFLIGTIAFLSVLFGPRDFITLLKEGFSGLQKLTVNQVSLWPNLFVAVGELNPSSIKEIIGMTGNAFWWLLVAGGLAGGLIQAFRIKDRTRLYTLIILAMTLAADLKITLSAERFILLCLIPVALLGTIGMQAIINAFRKAMHPQSLTPGSLKPIEMIAGFLLCIGTTFFPVTAINAQIPELLNPIFNATWEKALTDIKTQTLPESIVTSWWPPGHFIKAIADRRVTFDGATITKNKEAYWVANAFLTSNEREAAGILQMLNTDGVHSVEFLEHQGMKTSDAISLLHFILAKPKSEAFDFLKRILPLATAENLINRTHSPAPPSYLLLYTELMEKNIGLQFVAKWNFNKMEELNNDPRALKQLPPPNSPEFFEFLWTTMGGPYKYSEALISINQNGSKIEFTQGVNVDLDTMNVYIQSSKFGTGIPLSIIYLNNDQIIEKNLSNANLNYSVVFFKENTKYYCRLMSQELARSILAKMYFFKGKGLEFFKPLSLQSSLTGKDEIFVFELNRQRLSEDR